MNIKTEMEIRAQSMIETLGRQRIEAMDQVVYAKAETAMRDARIKALEDELEILKTLPPAEPAAG